MLICSDLYTRSEDLSEYFVRSRKERDRAVIVQYVDVTLFEEGENRGVVKLGRENLGRPPIVKEL